MKRIINKILSDRRMIFKRMSISADCQWFKDVELNNLEDLVNVFYHPQGVEFCQQNNFPSLAILRQFKSQSVERFGVYIDAGEVDIENPERAIIIGDTKANILCSQGGINIIAMHNAEVCLQATDWAVVRLQYNTGCKISTSKKDRAIIYPTETEVKV